MENFSRCIAGVLAGAACGIVAEKVTAMASFRGVANTFTQDQDKASQIDTLLNLALEVGLLAVGVNFVVGSLPYITDEIAPLAIFMLALNATTPIAANRLNSLLNVFTTIIAVPPTTEKGSN